MTPLARNALTLGSTCAALVALVSGPLIVAAAIACEWWASRSTG